MMTLPEYLTEHQLTQEAFAKRVGLNQATVSKLCRKGRPPISLDTALVIERETAGRVPVTVWPQFSALVSRIVSPATGDAP